MASRQPEHLSAGGWTPQVVPTHRSPWHSLGCEAPRQSPEDSYNALADGSLSRSASSCSRSSSASSDLHYKLSNPYAQRLHINRPVLDSNSPIPSSSKPVHGTPQTARIEVMTSMDNSEKVDKHRPLGAPEDQIVEQGTRYVGLVIDDKNG